MKKRNGSFLSVVLFGFVVPTAWANPTGGVVSSGTASITPSLNTLTIAQSSTTSIINWGTFSIANGETTVFQFPTAGSASLNLVAPGNPSTIAGILESTVGPGGPVGGTVLLLNPSGILFTPTAQVNVGSLVATTLGLADQNEFLNGQALHFSGTSTAGVQIQNGASLNAFGDIFLIAQTVQNAGTLSAANEVGLAAGSTVTLAQSGAERLSVVAGTPGALVGVDNTALGQINAVTTELKAAGGNIYALAINNGGAIRATSLVSQNGHVFLRATDSSTGNNGRISSTGSIAVDGVNVTSADVTVQGSEVTLGGGPVTAGGAINAGAGAVNITTTSGAGLNGSGNIIVNNGITAFQLLLHSGSDGIGNIQFGAAGVPIQAGVQTFWAGIGDGSANTAQADLTGQLLGDFAPALLNSSGSGAPGFFTYRQDASILDAAIPAAAQFGGTPPASLELASDGGDLTLATGGKVAGSQLELAAFGTTTIADNLNVASLALKGAVADPGGYTVSANSLLLLGGGAVGSGANPLLTAVNALTDDKSGGDAYVNQTGPVNLDGTTSGVGSLNLAASGVVTVDAGLNLGTAAGDTLTLNGAVADPGGNLVTANTLTLLGTGAVGSGANPLLTAVNTLSDNKAGGDAFVSQNGALNLDGTTTGAGALSVAASGTITIDAALNLGTGPGDNLTLNGAVADPGANTVTANTLTLLGTGGVGTGASRLITAVNTLTDDKSGGDTYVRQMAALNLDGITGGSGLLDVLAAGSVTIDAVLNLGTGPGDGLTLSASAIAVNGPVTASQAEFDAPAIALNSGSVNTGTGDQTYNGTVTLGNNLAENLTGSVIFNDPVIEAAGQNNSLTVNGAADLNGASVNTGTGDQTYQGTVTLGNGADETLTAGTVAFHDSVGEAGGQNNNLTINAATDLNGGAVNTGTGNQTYNGNVTQSADASLTGGALVWGAPWTWDAQNHSLTVDFLDNVTVPGFANVLNFVSDGAGGTTIAGTFTTSGSQEYENTVTLAAAGTLNATLVTFDRPVIEAPGQNYSLTVNAAADLNGGSVNTGTGNQTYEGLVTLGGSMDETLTGGTVAFNEALGEAGAQNDSLTVNGTADLNGGSVSTASGNQLYNGTVNLGGGRDENLTAGKVTFNDPVGEQALQNNSLTINGATEMDGGSVNTGTGTQAYNGNVDQGANAVLTGGSLGWTPASFTWDAHAHNLTLDFLNSVTVPGFNNVYDFVSDGAGGTTVAGNFTTLHNQTYDNAATLSANSILTGTLVTFATVLNGPHALTIAANAVFGGAVGQGARLASLTVNGSTAINGGSVTTSGGQLYKGAVTLGASAVNSGSTIDYASTLGQAGNYSLVNNASTIFGGSVTLGGLTDNGSTAMNGGSISTGAGSQMYNGNVTLGTGNSLNGGDITFNYGVASVGDLSAVGGGNLTLNSTIQAASVVDTENTTFNAGGTLANPTVLTSGGQTYSGLITLNQDTVLAGNPFPQINGSVSGNGFNFNIESGLGGGASGYTLALNNSGTATFNGAINGSGGGGSPGTPGVSPQVANPLLAADEDARRILANLAPRVKKGQVKVISAFPGKRIIKEPGYLKGSSDVPAESNMGDFSVYSALIQ